MMWDDNVKRDGDCFYEMNSDNGTTSLSVGILHDVELNKAPLPHDEAFIDGLLDGLSPIKHCSPTSVKVETDVSVSSTPLNRDARLESGSSSSVLRSVRRRRRSKFAEKKLPNRKAKSDRKLQNIPELQATDCKFEDAPMECSVTGESIDEILSAEKTIIPSSLSNSPCHEGSESESKSNESLIQVTDSLQMTYELHCKLTTSFDDIIMSNEMNLSGSCDHKQTKENNWNGKQEFFYGLPSKAKEALKTLRGIDKLYDWQNDCLNLPALQERKNLIYSLPTSGGKTLVAEILIMKELLMKEKNAILILPYVSIVQEKVRGISPFAVELGFYVEEYASSKGSFPPKKRRKKRSLYIATIEKADAIVNSLLENERTHELGLVVVDELHMIGEGGGRGARLEMTLAKILFCKAEIQIIGMSATLGNLSDLQEFLDADIYCNDFRPVQLTENIKLGDTVFHVDHQKLRNGEEDALKPVRTIAQPEMLQSNAKKLDPDQITTLALEVIPDNSCLVFCATKKNCENVAIMLTKCCPNSLKDVKQDQRKFLLKAIHDNVNNVCSVLRKTIPFGVAYHHSGLTLDERKLIEDAYSSGVLCILCCTSTLAAGVNLPAKRVILRAPYVGANFLTKSRYNQMIGRAGRAGIDSSGESIMVVQPKDKAKVMQLLQGTIDNCNSSLEYEDSKGIRAFILSAIGLKLGLNTDDIERLLKTTLFYVQASKRNDFDIKNRIRAELQRLNEVGLTDLKHVSKDGISTQQIHATNLGIATYKGCLDIDKTEWIYNELVRGAGSLVLSNELHLLYLITPLDSVVAMRLDWMAYYQYISKLSQDELKGAEAIGVSESFITRKAAGQSCRKDTVDEFVLKRFLLTLMIYQHLKEVPVWKIADTFHVTRGFVQSLLTYTGSFTYMLINFTSELPEFWSYKLLFEGIWMKLSQASTVELIPLMEIPGVKQARAKQLFKAGYHTLKDLAWANEKDLCQSIEHLPRKQAVLIISSAKMLLQEKAESLREEVEEMMMQP